MKPLRYGLRLALTMLSALAAVSCDPAEAQSYPTTNPTYTPAALLTSSSLSAAGKACYLTNGVGTLYARVSGTYTGMTGTFQGTESRATSPTYSTMPVDPVGGARTTNVTSNGLYRLNASGLAQVCFNMSAISTGSVTVTWSGGPGTQFTTQLPLTRATYSTTFTVATAASLTDFFQIVGSTSKVIRVTEVSCSGTATAIGSGIIYGALYSTADTGSSGRTTLTLVPHDSNSAAATAVAYSWTANPTLGTLIGNVRSSNIVLTPASSTTIPAARVIWSFGQNPGEQEIVLRDAAHGFSLNGNGVSLPSGASVTCNVTWTEE